MRSSPVKLQLAVMASVAMIAAGGCAGISGDSTLQEVLDASGLGSVTINDVLGAIEDFTGQSASLPFGQELTSDQQDQIASLQDQLNNGEITGQQYVEQLADVIGVQAVGRPFAAGPGRQFGPGGFRDGPLGLGAGPGPVGRLDANLDLTEAQQSQAQEIFDNMRTDIVALQDAAQTSIDAVLTADQLATLDSLDVGLFDGMRFLGAGAGLNRVINELGLSDDQQTQIQSILDQLKTDMDARRQKARDEFRAILTADQLATLDELDAPHELSTAGESAES